MNGWMDGHKNFPQVYFQFKKYSYIFLYIFIPRRIKLKDILFTYTAQTRGLKASFVEIAALLF